MIKKAYLLILFFQFSLLVFSTETIIIGNIPGGENQEVRLIGYTDMLTYTEEVLGRNRIDSAGNFSLSVNLQETIITFLDIGFYRSSIFLEPGISYVITCDSIKTTGQFRPYYQKDILPYTIEDDEDSGINTWIFEFDILYNEFLVNNFDAIYKRRKKNLVYEFREDIERRFDTIGNKFFKDYVNYKIASIELAAVSVEKPELFMKYFHKQPILLNNVEYMYFFNQFFKRYLTAGTKAIYRSDLNNSINIDPDYYSLFDVLGKDTLLKNERLRELVMLKGLMELYNNPDYSNENILQIITEVSSMSNFSEHKKIAESCYRSLTKLQAGTIAPEINLLTLEGDSISLTDFIGKPLYLSFMTTWSYACLAEFELMDTLYSRYKDKVHFITISLDNNIDIVKKFKTEKEYNWPFLYNGNQYDLMDAYDLKTFPMFALINSEGKISQYPAYKPSEYIQESIDRLLEQKSRE